MNNKEKGIKTRTQILRDVVHHPSDISNHIAKIFSITPQAVYSHLSRLEKEDRLHSTGRGKGKQYFLGNVRNYDILLPLNKELSEDDIWRKHFSFIFEGLPENIIDICHYGFTEMVNNAIDHSDGTLINMSIDRDKDKITIYLQDNGEGIFKRIKRLCNLANEKQAIMELAKGKLTTDPDNHTGEGIFFTSRVFDKFEIDSFGLNFSHDDNLYYDVLLDSNLEFNWTSTLILMKIKIDSKRLIKDIFDEYTFDETNIGTSQFNKTVIPVKLAQYGNEKLVSRSQAKRLLTSVDKFHYIIFDFKDVLSIGQAFADEIFRVYANKNDKLILLPTNMSEDVEKMINRALGK